jgi:hypothetical protein
MFPIDFRKMMLSPHKDFPTVARILCSVTFCLLFSSTPSAGIPMNNTAHDSLDKNITLEKYIRSESKTLSGKDYDEIFAMIIFFENFSCLPCLNDFMEFCDSLRSGNMVHPATFVILLMARNEQPPGQQAISMKRWENENGILFPLICTPRNLFAEWNIERSTFILWKKEGGIELRETLPISHKRQTEILGRLRKGSPK